MTTNTPADTATARSMRAPGSGELARRIHPADLRTEFREAYATFLEEIKEAVRREGPLY